MTYAYPPPPAPRRPVPPGFFRQSATRPLVIGHRGVRREGLDENTLPAFEAAAREGADALELDVRVCASGEVVVAHDPTLERVTGGDDLRPIAELRWLELARVSLLHGARVPLLSEALDFAASHRLPVNVEMKRDAPSRPAIVRAVGRLLGSWDRARPILVSSFDPAMLLGLRAIAPRIPVAILLHRTKWYETGARAAAVMGADAVHLERTLTRPELVRAIRERRQMLNVWTVNEPGEVRDLAALGVDGLITDDPAGVRAALDV